MYVPQCRKRGDAVHLFLPYYLQDISQREGDGGEGGSCVQKVRHLKRKEEWGGGGGGRESEEKEEESAGDKGAGRKHY